MKKNESGQSLLEFALVIPVLLLLLCGILDLGRELYGYFELNMDAQEAARLGSLGKSDAEITSFAQQYIHSTSAPLTVTITPDEANRHSGDYVTVKLQYTMSYLTPLVGNLLPSPVISSASTIRVE